MDKKTFEEIKSILAKCERPDLIQKLKKHVKIDEDYTPPKRVRRDSLSDSEGSAVDEEYEVECANGFYSLA